jgi:peptidoglycan hydrolase-like protein with peptidoglycan-binding domain
MGGKTKAALKKYQKANGLKASGMVDDATKMKLGL